MRIIAGKYKKANIDRPSSDTTRPTKDRVREAIFSSLGVDYLVSKSVLDLFAGSAAYALEALSRGASHASICEIDTKAYKVIKDNLTKLKVSPNDVSLYNMDYNLALAKMSDKKVSFDAIFLDPPYAFKDYFPLLEFIHNKHLLNKGGCIIIETDEIIDFSYYPVTMRKEYKYKDTYVTILWSKKS